MIKISRCILKSLQKIAATFAAQKGFARRKKVLFSPLHQMILSSITTQKGIFISLNSYFSFTELTSGGNYEEAGAAIKMREKSHLLEEDSFS